MFSRLTRVVLFKQRLADATFFLLFPVNQRKQIERVQIDAIKFETISVHFFSDVFTAVTVVVTLLKLPSKGSRDSWERDWQIKRSFILSKKV